MHNGAAKPQIIQKVNHGILFEKANENDPKQTHHLKGGAAGEHRGASHPQRNRPCQKPPLCVREAKTAFFAELLDFICIHIYNYTHKSSHGPQYKHAVAVHADEGCATIHSVGGTDFDKERFK